MVCGPTPNRCFQVADLLHHRENFEAPVIQPKQHAQSPTSSMPASIARSNAVARQS